jgi:potassium uptake Trk family protein
VQVGLHTISQTLLEAMALTRGGWARYVNHPIGLKLIVFTHRVFQFNAVSAFNNSGMSLLDANMVAFQKSIYLQMTMGFLILAGNTAYPLLLRLFVWCMYRIVLKLGKTSPAWSKRAETLRFLLDHPRRCYTNLFPAQHTWWLLLSVVTLNGVDWAAFEILNIGNDTIYTEVPSTGIRVMNGLFQAFAVRSGGFYVVIIAKLRISLQVLYVVMMYISVYPVVITMRNSNVYEERSLGIYAEDEAERRKTRSSSRGLGFVRTLTDHLVPELNNGKQSNGQFVRQQLRAQLAHDAWTIVLALFLIMIIEGSRFSEDPAAFSVFNFLFEIVSAYGCVGISVGIPTADYSFSGSWHVLSKLILCVVMLRGRHRGLPVAIDQAVLLPGDRNAEAEEDDGRIRRARSASRGARNEIA